MFHAFIWLSEKNITHKNFWKKKKKKNRRALLFKMLKLRVLDLFFHWNVFVITQRVKYRKKVPLGTGTEFQAPIPVPVPVQMWTVPNPTTYWSFVCKKYMYLCAMFWQ